MAGRIAQHQATGDALARQRSQQFVRENPRDQHSGLRKRLRKRFAYRFGRVKRGQRVTGCTLGHDHVSLLAGDLAPDLGRLADTRRQGKPIDFVTYRRCNAFDTFGKTGPDAEQPGVASSGCRVFTIGPASVNQNRSADTNRKTRGRISDCVRTAPECRMHGRLSKRPAKPDGALESGVVFRTQHFDFFLIVAGRCLGGECGPGSDPDGGLRLVQHLIRQKSARKRNDAHRSTGPATLRRDPFEDRPRTCPRVQTQYRQTSGTDLLNTLG